MSPLAARSLVFFTSAAVLVLEIMAGRLLAPFLGVTLETFTGIIGTVLAGISIGAWLGGRAADRYDPRSLLGPTLVAGGILALTAPPIVTWIGPLAGSAGPAEIVAITAVAFFAPALVLSMVPPIVVKIRLRDLAETGAVVGRLSAIGTAGAIFGTFVTGFLLIAAFATRPIIFGLGTALVTIGLALWWRGTSMTRVVAGLLVAATAGTALVVAEGPCDHETAYFCARVTTDATRPSGRILWLDTMRHSYVDLEDPTFLGFRYARLMSDALEIGLGAGPVDTLFVGGGGLTLPRFLAATRPGSTSLVLELDPSIIDIARKELGFVDDGSTTIVTGDARLGIAAAPERSFDLVVGDAFGGPSVPWHLATREFVVEIRERLRPGGIYTLNLIDHPPLGFARAETATLSDVFEHVAILAPVAYLEARAGGNFVLVASDEPIDVAAIAATTSARGASERAITGSDVATFIGDAVVLTDDFAPVDQLISRS